MVSSSLVRHILKTVSIFNPSDGEPKSLLPHMQIVKCIITWIIVVKAPGPDVVLGELGVGEQLHGVGHQLHVVLIKLLQLQVYPANLSRTGSNIFIRSNLHYSLDSVCIYTIHMYLLTKYST